MNAGSSICMDAILKALKSLEAHAVSRILDALVKKFHAALITAVSQLGDSGTHAVSMFHVFHLFAGLRW